jgi:AcrR family transcriptional regulator
MTQPATATTRRTPLSRDRVLRAAVDVADAHGVDGVTMRSVGESLGVEGMALYRHVAGKDELLDGLVSTVLEEVTAAATDLPTSVDHGEDWRPVARALMLRAREVLLQHPWAPALIATRGTTGGVTLPWYEQLCGILFSAGFSDDLVHHALHALGSRALGFSTELFAADSPAEEDPATAVERVRELTATMPNIGRVVASMTHDATGTLGGCDDQAEFEFGLDVVLDGLEARRASGAGA